MNQAEPTRPARTFRVWVIILVLALISVPILFVAIFAMYLSTRATSIESHNRALVAERLAAQVHAQTAAAPSAPLTTASSSLSRTEPANPQTTRIKVEFTDFDSRTGDALVIDVSNGLSYLAAPSSLFVPATGKLNGRMVTQQPSLITLSDAFSQTPSSGGGLGTAAGMPGMMGPPSLNPDNSVVMAGPLPGLGLTLLGTATRLTPLRIKGDFAEVAVGEALSVNWLTPPEGAPPALTVLATDQSITDADGQQLVHMLKLTALQQGIGALVYNSTGQPVGQIVVTRPDQSGSTFTYAAPLGRIFDVYYEQQSAEKSNNAAAEPDTRAQDIPPAITPTNLPVATSPNGPIQGNAPLLNELLPEAVKMRPETDAPSLEIDAASPAAANGLADGPVDALHPVDQSAIRDLRVYKTGAPPEAVANRLRPLLGSSAQVAVDSADNSVLIVADRPTHEKAAAMLRSIDKAEVRKRHDAAPRTATSNDGEAANPGAAASTEKDLVSPGSIGAATVTMRGSVAEGLVGQTVFDPTQQATRGPTRRGDLTLDDQARQLAQRYLSAPPAERTTLRKELQDLTERHFNLRQAERQREIDEISSRVEKLRAAHQQRQQHKAEVIDRRIQDLLDINSDFWTGEVRHLKGPPGATQADKGGNQSPFSAAPRLPTSNRTRGVSSSLPGEITSESSVEKTFDGIPYGQWTQMLATERKPAKLAMAMDACSRLARAEDQPRIARQIIEASQSLEAGNDAESTLVWETSWESLGRLRPEVVASELLAAIQTANSTADGRRYQGRSLAQKLSKPVREQILRQQPKIIEELVQLQQQEGSGVDWLLAGATVLWLDTGRPLEEFASLQARMIKMVDDGFGTVLETWNEQTRPEWQIVAEVLISKAPETPDLALMLMKHAGRNEGVLRMIGTLGRYAEPAVPKLVDDFVATWNAYERESRLYDPRSPSARADSAVPHRCRELITALGKIGVGEKGAFLLRDLRLVLPPPQVRSSSPRQVRLGSLSLVVDAALAHWTLPSNDSLPLILNDHTMITGSWRLSDGLPSATTDVLYFDQSSVQLPRSESDGIFLSEVNQKLGDRYELNPSAAIKQISFFDVSGSRGSVQKEVPGTRRDGIYELTGTKLRFQLAGPGQPRPTAFAKDRSELGKEEILLEFERDILEWVGSTPESR